MNIIVEMTKKTIWVLNEWMTSAKSEHKPAAKHDPLMIDCFEYKSLHHSSNSHLIREYCDLKRMDI